MNDRALISVPIGDPSGIGLNEASVGGMAETTLYITPTGSPVRDAKPTLAA